MLRMLIYCTLLRADPDLEKKMRPREPVLGFFKFLYTVCRGTCKFLITVGIYPTYRFSRRVWALETNYYGTNERHWDHSTNTGTYVLVSPVLFSGDCPDEHGGVQVGRQLAAGPQVPHRGSSGCSGRGSTTSTTFLPTIPNGGRLLDRMVPCILYRTVLGRF